ncbi:ABC transporter permease subunit [Phreatobacter aquaticus]|uniref:ABC transporter permease subunit n=1 Tax=Phreatobacter aquaticus TaxID=2570229 RepID=A0A4D7QGW6_9HYPH|nr:ABC transporter permease subunit [Phreatobacter aquaticus]QCK85099.1 ABC transporter permease subunit [Phreatobacter aquaticus]
MSDRAARRITILIPYLWLVLFFLVPFGIVAKMSLSQVATAVPPYVPNFGWGDGWSGWLDKARELSSDNYAVVLGDSLYIDAFLTSLRIAATGTLILLIIGYPMAHAMARASAGIRPLLVMAVILPFWTSFLIRIYAWIGILKPEGLLNEVLLAVGLISERLQIANTEAAVLVGVVYSYLPFMVLPLYAALERLDRTLLEAAGDLGCPPWRAFWRITVPLTLPGIAAGCFLCFIPIVGEVVIPDLLGGSDTLMIGKTLWTEFFSNRDWPVASSVAILLLVVLVGPIMVYQHLQARQIESRR